MLGRTIVSVHPQRSSTVTEEFQGVVSEITSTWEDGPDGRPVLFCRTKTIGKQDVCDQRSWVNHDSKGTVCRLTVETRLVKRPGEAPVAYDRIYEVLDPE